MSAVHLEVDDRVVGGEDSGTWLILAPVSGVQLDEPPHVLAVDRAEGTAREHVAVGRQLEGVDRRRWIEALKVGSIAPVVASNAKMLSLAITGPPPAAWTWVNSPAAMMRLPTGSKRVDLTVQDVRREAGGVVADDDGLRDIGRERGTERRSRHGCENGGGHHKGERVESTTAHPNDLRRQTDSGEATPVGGMRPRFLDDKQ